MKGYSINTGYPLDQSIRMVLDNIIRNMALYKHPLKKPGKTIHQSRKSIKRIRAILKMIRYETGYSFYYRENRFFRDLSRQMSPARDLSVLLQTLKLLEKKHRDDFPETDIQLLKERLSNRKEAEIQLLTGSEGGFSAIAGELDEALLRMNSTLRLRHNFDSIGPGIKRIYRRGRQHLQEMHEERSTEPLHEYRKNCRYLQYQVELIQPLFPELLRSYASALDGHTEVLGKIRDFQRFRSYIQHEMSKVISQSGVAHIQHAVSQLEQKISAGVFRDAGLIFAENPRRFTERIQLYWNLQHSIN